MRLFEIRENWSLPYKGEINAAHPWVLPGTHCPTCHATWGGLSEAYPSVDLSHLPRQDLESLAEPHLERDYSEFKRLCALVQPLLPPGQRPRPGTGFGPLVGSAHGNFGAFYMPNPWTLLAQRATLQRLQAEGLLGLLGVPPRLRFRQKRPPELLELQVEPLGRLHPDCIPPEHRAPCPTCDRWAFTLPENLLLDKSALPSHTDLFRIGNATTVLVGTERFHDTVQRLGLEGLTLKEIPVR